MTLCFLRYRRFLAPATVAKIRSNQNKVGKISFSSTSCLFDLSVNFGRTASVDEYQERLVTKEMCARYIFS